MPGVGWVGRLLTLSVPTFFVRQKYITFHVEINLSIVTQKATFIYFEALSHISGRKEGDWGALLVNKKGQEPPALLACPTA